MQAKKKPSRAAELEGRIIALEAQEGDQIPEKDRKTAGHE